MIPLPYNLPIPMHNPVSIPNYYYVTVTGSRTLSSSFVILGSPWCSWGGVLDDPKAQFSKNFSVFWLAGQIVPFILVRTMTVQLFGAVRVLNIAPIAHSDRLVLFVRHERRMELVLRGWILH